MTTENEKKRKISINRKSARVKKIDLEQQRAIKAKIVKHK